MLATVPSPKPTTGTDMLAIKDVTTRANPGIKLRGGQALTREKIDATAQEFEAQFISQMMSTMFSTVDTSESLAGSDAEEVYTSMLENEYGKIIARSGGIGVADQVKQILMKQQEVE
jgi:peptidoglycan hydrolase FlgJ